MNVKNFNNLCKFCESYILKIKMVPRDQLFCDIFHKCAQEIILLPENCVLEMSVLGSDLYYLTSLFLSTRLAVAFQKAEVTFLTQLFEMQQRVRLDKNALGQITLSSTNIHFLGRNFRNQNNIV